MTEPIRQVRNRRTVRVAFVIVLIVGAATWLIAYERMRLPARFAVVEAGRLYRSSQPSTRQIQRLIDEYHIKTVLIVRSGESDRVPNEKEFCQAHGLRVVHIPIESRKSIPESQVQEFFKCVDDSSAAPILVHCSAGRHRTGYLCARYRIERQGWALQRAIEELLSFGFDTEHESVVLEQLRRYQPMTASRAQ